MTLGRLILSLAILAAAWLAAPNAVADPGLADLYDISWPNCNSQIPAGAAGFIGVTGGLSFSHNPCLKQESAKLTKFGLYLNSGYPGKKAASKRIDASCGDSCSAYRYGYQSAVDAVDYATSQGVMSNIWWIDIETQNSWSKSPNVNRSAIQGIIDGINNFVHPKVLGIYSHPRQWQQITGSWKNRLPVWQATGSLSRAKVTMLCGQTSGFTGGPVWLVQYTDKYDLNVQCTPDASQFFSIAG